MQEDEVKFNVFEAVRIPAESEMCFVVETVEAIVSNQRVSLILRRLAWCRVI